MITEYTIKCNITVDDEGDVITRVLPNLNAGIGRNILKNFLRQPVNANGGVPIADAVQHLATALASIDNAGEVIIALLISGIEAMHELSTKQRLESEVLELLATLTHNGGPIQ